MGELALLFANEADELDHTSWIVVADSLVSLLIMVNQM